MRCLASLIAVCLILCSGCGAPTPSAAPTPPKADAPSATAPTASPAAEPKKSGDAVQVKGISVAPVAEAPEKKGQGLLLTIEAVKPGPGGKTPQVDSRSSRLIALYVPEGSAPTPFLPPGPLKATWEGDLTVGMRDEYIFSADGRGKLTFLVNDAPVLETSGEDLSKTPGKTVKLNKGKNKVTAKYESPEKGDANVRLYWQSASGEFAREPLPIVQLSHNVNQKPLLESRRLREGRELFATMRCTKCHDAAGLLPKPAADVEDAPGMPELDIDAPNLSDAGARLNVNWMAKWITNPRALRPESSMPQVLHGATLEKDALDIAGFLGTLGNKVDKDENGSEEDIKAGGGLVAKLGCVGCHTMPDKVEMSPDRIPLRNVRAKWKPAALREFLKQPDKHYAWIRMPNFRFSDDEIKKIAAFILFSKIEGTPAGAEAVKGTPDVENGKKLVQSAGCLSCHKMGDGLTNGLKAPAIAAIADAGWSKGCMAAKNEGKSPEFAFSAAQRDAIVAFVGEAESTPLAKGGLHGGSLLSEALPEFAERQIKQLRCTACHSRDDQDDVWSGVDSEVEAIKIPEAPPEKDPNADPNAQEPQLVEQNRPRLTWIGEKLKPEWMAGFISGKINEKTPTELKDENGKVIPMGKPRTWLHARMPNFPRRAPLLAKGLVVEHGCIPVSKAEPAPDEKLAEVGRKLVGKNGGLGCTACHPVGIAPAVGVFEAPGLNLMLAKSRILKSYFHRWIRDPLRVEAGSKMPTFATQGKTQLTDIFGGDATQQFEAIWQYLLNGEKIQPPEE